MKLGSKLEKKCIGFKPRERNVLGSNLEKKCIGFKPREEMNQV